ncbi:uncharacterized protein LOC133361940 [Lethenteron reissneri]|uniref:uncharacterized protein LOC133361940 n=1 Tax=Lethenteron reissneri TaxID=7753 RepID=UPI002AB76A0B|nr:uncharacterized protein LOC133361940 [Lethenteron reissneri]
MTLVVVVVVAVLALQIANGAGSSVGRQFFGAFMQNYLEGVDALVVDFISYDSSAQVTVSVPAENFSSSVLLPPFSVGNVSIPVTAEIAENGIVTNKVVSVHSDSDISVWGMSKRIATTDGFMMIPEQELGTEYYVVAPVSGGLTLNEFAIVSPYNNVTVLMILSSNVIFNGVTYSNELNITLQENQVVQFQGSSLTGTRVLSSQPVAVFSGDQCINVHTACNFVTEQLLPVSQWGSSYLVFPVSIKSTDDSVIITSPTSASVIVNVSVAGNLTTYTLTNYDRISVPIYANQMLSINSSVNVGVMYICQGGYPALGDYMDPFQMNIIPTSKFSNMYLFATQPDFTNILIVIAKDADKCEIVMNNGTLCDKIQWVRTNDLLFVAGELNLGGGNQQFRVEHATQPFGLYLYGVAYYDSFGYVLSYGNLRGNGAGSSVGRQFFGAFMQNAGNVADALVVDFVSYDSNAQVTVSIPAVNFSQAILLPPFSVGNVSIPVTAEITENGIVTNKVVSVRSDSDISVWGMSKRIGTTDGFMMIAEQELGTEYYVVAPVSGSVINEFAIVSPYNNVTVQMILNSNVIFNGVTYSNELNITLQDNQVVQFQGSSLTGTRVLSSQPVAVYSGDWCMIVHTGCNFVTEQLLPVSQWGSSYLVFPVSIKSTNDSVIITSPTSASVSVNVSVAGNLTTYTLTNYGRISVPVYANQTLSINSSVSVGVMYICQGGSTTLWYSMDPFQMNIIPTSKFSNMYLFATQPDFINMLIVIAKDADKCGIVMNNEPLCNKIQWVRTNDLQFVAGELNLGLGNQQFQVEHATQPFGLYLYGVGDYDSFGYVLSYGNLRGGVCRVNLANASGTIQFADLLARPNVGDCLWTITGAVGTAVILRFQTFSLQTGAEVVYVYDGPSVDSPLLGKYDRDGVPAPIISSSNTLSVRATYDTRGIAGNFSAFYRVGSPCRETLVGSQGSLSLSNFSAAGERSALCRWTVQVDPRYEVKLSFQQFNLSSDPDCVDESLTVYDDNGDSLGAFCGGVVRPPSLRSSSNRLHLVLDSLRGLQGNGVVVNFETINPINVSKSCGVANASVLSAWPWQVTVTRQTDQLQCLGSLLSDSWVVTAASCLLESPGNYSWSCTMASGERLDVTAILVDPKFSAVTGAHDVAMLRLGWRATLGPSVQAVCLPSRHEQSPPLGRSCQALGLRRSDGSVSAPATEGNVRLVNESLCTQAWGNFSRGMKMCAAKRQGWASSCQLGQGGGVFCLGTDRRWYLTGIDSRRADCANATQPAAYGRVWKSLAWIEGNLPY